MPQLFLIKIDLHGHPADWQFNALHSFMQSEGFCRKQRQLTAPEPLSNTSYLGRPNVSEEVLHDSLISRITQGLWGDTHIRISALRA